MRKTLFKAFDSVIRERLPAFSHVGAGGKKGVRLYEWKPSDDVSIFLALVLSPNSDAFTWEAAWSARHEFPWHLYPMSPLGNENADIPPADPVDGEFRFRIPKLWDTGRDTWWHVRGDFEKEDLSLEEFVQGDWAAPPRTYSDEQVLSVVDGVISRIESDVMPFVESGVSRMLNKNVFSDDPSCREEQNE